MAKAGTFNFTYSRVQPYSRGNIFVQPFDWLEAGFRYSDISNRAFDPAAAEHRPEPQGQELRREIQALGRIRVAARSSRSAFAISPARAFSRGEYVVASKRTDAFDWTLGLGWGNVGGRGNLRNPLSLFSSKFDTRRPISAEGGTPLLRQLLSGARLRSSAACNTRLRGSR